MLTDSENQTHSEFRVSCGAALRSLISKAPNREKGFLVIKIFTSLKPRKSLWALLFVTVVATISQSAVLSVTPNRRLSQVIRRIRKAHIISSVSPHSFDSYRLSGCMYIQQTPLSKKAANMKLNCITEETGVLQPSLAYVSVVIGSTRVTEIIDINQTKGWHITSLSTGSIKSGRNVSLLQKSKYDALLENTRHSLLAFLGVLNGPDDQLRAGLDVSHTANAVVLSWREGASTNEFWFNPRTFLCEKQVRTVAAGTTVLKYSNYKRVSNVMLPHTIVMVKEDGTTVATRVVGQWSLATEWLKNSFDPEEIGGFE